MEAIKRWLDPKRKTNSKTNSPKPRISSPVSGTFKKLTDGDVTWTEPRAGARSAGALVTTDFVPRDRGRKATLAWLSSRAPDAIARLAQERDCAARQVRRGPRTFGNREVQEILRAPSRRAVARFHLVRRQAEVAVRYGVSGAVAYNFSRSLRWNKVEAPRRLPSLQLRGYDGGKPSGVTVAPAGPFTPIDWLELEVLGPASSSEEEEEEEEVVDCADFGAVSPISEPGGWRDTSELVAERPESRAGFERGEDVEDVDVERPELPRISTDVERELDAPQTPNAGDVCEDQDEWETSEAKVVVLAGVAVRGAREVYVKPHSRLPVGSLTPIDEVSSPEEKVCAY